MKKKSAALRWRAEATAAENARAELPAALKRFLQSGDRLAAAGSANPATLHQLRLAAKHIRYGLEAFQAVYGARLGDLLESLREAQQRLGSISDATATSRWLRSQGLAGEPDAAAVITFLTERAEREAREFAQFWREKWTAEAFRRHWMWYLVRYAGAGRRRPVEAASGEQDPAGERAGTA